MAVKPGSRMAMNQASTITGVVLQIDANLIALIRLDTGAHVRVRADVLPGKCSMPQPGETWLFDQRHSLGWQFAVPLGWSPDVDWVALTPQGSWTAPSGAWMPLGCRNDSGGWVTLRGRVSGGSAGSTALTLPVGRRPGGDWLQPVAAGTGLGLVLVTSAGLVKPQTATSPVSLDGVRFLAAG